MLRSFPTEFCPVHLEESQSAVLNWKIAMSKLTDFSMNMKKNKELFAVPVVSKFSVKDEDKVMATGFGGTFMCRMFYKSLSDCW